VFWIVLICAIHLGDIMWRHATGNGKPNGLLLMALGGAGALASLVFNIRRTNLVYGIAGTALKFACALLFVLFANFTVIGWLGLGGLIASCSDDKPRRGRPHIPLPGERHWNDPRWNDWRWSTLRWDDLRGSDAILPWDDPRWNDPTAKDPRSR
jgi:hypothetical protein